jgi:hypothetical protein
MDTYNLPWRYHSIISGTNWNMDQLLPPEIQERRYHLGRLCIALDATTNTGSEL